MDLQAREIRAETMPAMAQCETETRDDGKTRWQQQLENKRLFGIRPKQRRGVPAAWRRKMRRQQQHCIGLTTEVRKLRSMLVEKKMVIQRVQQT